MPIRLTSEGDVCPVRPVRPAVRECYVERGTVRAKGRFDMVRFFVSGRTVPVWCLLTAMAVVAVLSAGIVYRTQERDNARRELYRQLVNAEVLGGQDANDRAVALGLLRFTFAE